MTEQAYQTMQVTYACMHTATFRKPWPKVGDELICNRCRKETFVFMIEPHWRNNCLDCRFGRSFGVDGKLTAGQSAAKHANARGHRVGLYLGESLAETIIPGPDTLC